MSKHEGPRCVQYFQPVLDGLRALDSSAKPKEVCNWIAENLDIPKADIERTTKGGQTIFENDVHWARWHLVQAGLIGDEQHGVWVLTEQGRKASLSDDDAHSLFKDNTDRMRREKSNDQSGPRSAVDDEDTSPPGSQEEEQEIVTSEPPVKMPPATNLILYGPPGTGKTYATAWEAVRLCIGDDAADQWENDREGLMIEYHRLVREGRIEFVTFHQSFSYEDFVEGLRPTTATNEQDGAIASGGFSLKAHAGVFKAISERARLDTGNAVTKRLDRSRPVYKIALGRRGSQEDRIREGLDRSLIHIGWGG